MSASIKIINGKIITTNRVIDNGSLFIDNGQIIKISADKINLKASMVLDAKENYVSPGFIDIHVHGGGGSDFMDGTVPDFLKIAETHCQYGTTAMVPTTLTSEKDELLHILSTYKKACVENTNGAQFLGMHIEGPYFAMSQRGAQNPKYIRNPDIKEYTEIIEKYGDIISRWSAAPELDGALTFGSYLQKHGMVASVAHTDAVYEDIVKAFESGYTLATHFYSSMSGVTRKNAYRSGGVIEAVYLEDEFDVEIIADGSHLPAELLRLIVKIKGTERTALITDAMRAAGTMQKQSILGSIKNGLKVIIEDGVAKLPDSSSFAGSVATTNRLVKNMIDKAGVSIVDAVRMMTLTPARIMKIERTKGSICLHKDADLVIFDNAINVKATIVGGKILYNNF